jgi:hypothetical protein
MPLSERTKNYVQALIRDGDAFDHKTWLASIRAEEAAKSHLATELTAAPDFVPGHGQPTQSQHDGVFPPLIQSAVRQLPAGIEQKSPKTTIRDDLKRVVRAWDESQKSRERDAIYRYLTRVFKLVRNYRIRGRLNKLIRQAQRLAGLAKNKRTDAYTAVIRATTAGEIDHRAISKYARALRFSSQTKGNQALPAFIKGVGGLNACASRFAENRRRK